MIMLIMGIIQKSETKISLTHNASKLPSYFVYMFYDLIVARPTQVRKRFLNKINYFN